ncbi:cyclin-like protein [Nitzschia inconspicua]|uniref:Cyclin-like protein n=1 Tax=Nitzschia inconspicua TaxID=303405 RepID=A0A9K3LJH4_9STRA|nr:cyclin-like protein [Nitzschia inconspicua]
MGELDFDNSTQAKYWMFDEQSLQECQEEACKSVGSSKKNGTPLVRKAASGYHNKNSCSTKGKQNNGVGTATTSKFSTPVPTSLRPQDQEMLVHFHAHQIQRLIGPNATFPALRRSSSVLSTAIMLFRRFYLSNSVIDFHPRNIAAASALLACKADCEQRLPIDVLSHATWVIQMKTAHHAPQLHLCQEELRAVSIQEIEAAERALLQGCDYRLRCHHPYGAIKVLASDISNYLMEMDSPVIEGGNGINGSPKSVFCSYHHSAAEAHHYKLLTLCERALSVAQSALVYSDVNFLFPPGQIAFAAIAVALDGYGYGTKLGGYMREYLAMRFRNKSFEERSDFEIQVGRIVSLWEKSSSIDLDRFSPHWHFSRDNNLEEIQAFELRRAFHLASKLRMHKSAKESLSKEHYTVSPMPHIGYYHFDPHGSHYHHPYHFHDHYNPYHQEQQQRGHPSTYFVPIHENGSIGSGRNKRRRDGENLDYYHRRCAHRRSPTSHEYPPSSQYSHYFPTSNSINKVARVTPIMMDH